jgi:ribosome-associated translation inhibitor RaiA
MKVLNSKLLLHFVFNQMEKLDKKETSVQEAQAQANLSKQAFNLLEYERKRAETLLKLKGSTIELREIESKPFNDPI